MKLIFNLTIRSLLLDTFTDEQSSCRLCEHCTGLSSLDVVPGFFIDDIEGNYYCSAFDTDVDIVHAEDKSVPCSLFSKLDLKKL